MEVHFLLAKRLLTEGKAHVPPTFTFGNLAELQAMVPERIQCVQDERGRWQLITVNRQSA